MDVYHGPYDMFGMVVMKLMAGSACSVWGTSFLLSSCWGKAIIGWQLISDMQCSHGPSIIHRHGV